MREKVPTAPLDRRLAELGLRQHGVVTRAQLLALGLSDDAIGRRVRAGRLHRVHRGVYAIGLPRLSTEGRFLAAVLAVGEGAVLSHVSAAVLWGLLGERGPRVDVTVPVRGGRRRRRLVIVHGAALPAQDITLKNAIPVTTPARTIVDLADVLPRRTVERAIDEAAYLRLDLQGLRPLPGRRGCGLLSRVLAEHEPGSTRTRTDLEELMLALCRRYRLPQPRVNTIVEGYEVDFAWPAERLIVETDGWQAHGTRAAFEADRRRDAELIAAGWRVMRITWRRIEREPGAVAGQLAGALA
jgi:very-short-patch-repair endonuclease